MSSSQGEVLGLQQVRSQAKPNISVYCMSFGFPNMVQVLGGVKESLRVHREDETGEHDLMLTA